LSSPSDKTLLFEKHELFKDKKKAVLSSEGRKLGLFYTDFDPKDLEELKNEHKSYLD